MLPFLLLISKVHLIADVVMEASCPAEWRTFAAVRAQQLCTKRLMNIAQLGPHHHGQKPLAILRWSERGGDVASLLGTACQACLITFIGCKHTLRSEQQFHSLDTAAQQPLNPAHEQ